MILELDYIIELRSSPPSSHPSRIACRHRSPGPKTILKQGPNLEISELFLLCVGKGWLVGGRLILQILVRIKKKCKLGLKYFLFELLPAHR